MSALLIKAGVPNDAAIRAVLALEKLSDEDFGNLDRSVIVTIDGAFIRLPEPGGRGQHYRLATMEAAQIDDTYVPIIGVVFNVTRVLAQLP